MEILAGNVLLKPMNKVSTVWKILRSKRGIVFLITYAICSFLFLSFLKSKIYPEDIDCNIYNDVKFKLENKLRTEFFEENVKIFVMKYFGHINFNINGWTEITKDVFVYSAYIDTCPSNIALSLSLCVFFIGITLTNTTDTDSVSSHINCAVKRKSDVINIGLATTEILPENHSKAYTAAFFYCNLKGFPKDSSLPDQATLFKSSISTWVPVTYLTPNMSSSNIAASLCVRPLYGSYSSVHLSEFLAYYSTMGVEHFIFYHQNISDAKYVFLKFLKASNLSIEVLMWDIPLSDDLIHEYGQMVFTQDCIVRSKYRFSHTIIVDMDEFIVPKLHPSIIGLISYLDNKYENAGSYTIPMVLFCEEFLHEKQYSPFHLFSSNKRQKTPWSYGIRSKYILRPDRVHHAGIHFVWKFERNWFEVKVPDSVALLHHYRLCCGVLQTWFFDLFSFHVLKDDIVIDNSLINHAYKVTNHTLITFILNVMNLTSNIS